MILPGAHLERAALDDAHLEGKGLGGAHLEGAFASADTSWPNGFDWKAAKVYMVD